MQQGRREATLHTCATEAQSSWMQGICEPGPAFIPPRSLGSCPSSQHLSVLGMPGTSHPPTTHHLIVRKGDAYMVLANAQLTPDTALFPISLTWNTPLAV